MIDIVGLHGEQAGNMPCTEIERDTPRPLSYYFSELYSPKAVWLSLSLDEKKQLFGRIAEGMKSLADMGVEVITIGRTDTSKLHTAAQRYFALWKFPNEQALDALLAGIQATGWHDYFETVNAAGVGTDLSTHLQELADFQ